MRRIPIRRNVRRGSFYTLSNSLGNLAGKISGFHLILVAFLSILLLLLTTQGIRLSESDLGRHITNGKLILGGMWEVLSQNYYSYSYPDYPFLNHHWLTGVAFYLLQDAVGFIGLGLIYRLLGLITFIIYFRLAKKVSDFNIAFWVSLMTIPVLAYRTEVRPEGISQYFFGVFVWILYHWRIKSLDPSSEGISDQASSGKGLWLLPLIMVLWVNFHIYFFLGFVILGVMLIELLLHLWWSSGSKEARQALKELIPIAILCGLVSFLNPETYHVVLLPFGILNQYGYDLLENQTPFFFLQRKDILIPQLDSYWILLLLIPLGLVLGWIVDRNQFKKPGSVLILGLGILTTLFGMSAVRNFGIFSLMAIPFLAFCWGIWFKQVSWKRLSWILKGACLLSWGWYLGAVYPYLFSGLGLGLSEGSEQAAMFFKDNHLSGPILNNYDNGGYLIYYLNGLEKVFVDNRPEAYPVSFFKNIYIPLLGNESFWQERNSHYHFNTIFFSRTDLTPWAKTFLKNRLRDPEWALVYEDRYTLILVRKVPRNQEIIRKFQI